MDERKGGSKTILTRACDKTWTLSTQQIIQRFVTTELRGSIVICHLAESDEWKSDFHFQTFIIDKSGGLSVSNVFILRAYQHGWMANMRLGRLSTHANDIDSCEHFTHPKCDKVYRLCWRLSCRKRFFTAEIMCSDTMSLWYTFPDDCPTINFRLTIWRWTVITTKIVQSFFRGVTVTMKIFRFCFIEVLNSLIFFLLQNVMVFKFEIYSNTFLPHKTQQSWHSCITCSDWDHSFCYADEVIRDFTSSLAAAVKCAQLLGLQCLCRHSSLVFWFEKNIQWKLKSYQTL